MRAGILGVVLSLLMGAVGASAAAPLRWTIESTPSNPSFLSTLSDVSCPNRTECEAVGDQSGYYGSPQPLIERRDRAGWSAQTTPAPSTAGATGIALSGVSCPRSNACMAVGEQFTSSGATVPEAERFDGTSWQLVSVPAPAGASSADLSGVSCPGPRRCTAVGFATEGSGPTSTNVPIAARWDGRQWTLQSVPAPTGFAHGSVLGRVSCASSRACIALGSSQDANFVNQTLVESWDGARWTILPNPTAPGAQLSGIACIAPRRCIAVGSSSTPAATVPLAERWNGRTWTSEPIEAPPSGTSASLDAVACPRASRCVAVGGTGAAGNPTAPFSERWNGRAWRIVPVPAPSGPRSGLNGVSCPAPRICSAVGQSFPGPSSAQEFTLAERLAPA